ncbi:MAG: 30S ribosomal protein S6 [Verrucomicrobia bacterium RIFCSPLOWO2_12_FULL_64_8]|nr:MAG: 30S ribosomal protein S6 [Verrucomicrobia bacterium RIFCSPLOWO2_12_FULL_64_8]
MTQTKRSYRATFILDNRGREDTIDQIIEGVKKEIAAVHGEVTAVENLGKKDFVRTPDKQLTGAVYVQVTFSAPIDGPRHLHERLRLNPNVYRTLVQAV